MNKESITAPADAELASTLKHKHRIMKERLLASALKPEPVSMNSYKNKKKKKKLTDQRWISKLAKNYIISKMNI